MSELLPAGRTWITRMASAPFPWPGAPEYTCDEVLLHAPASLSPAAPFTTLLWLHGQGSTLRRSVLGGPSIPAQVDASGAPVVLVAPQLAYDAADSSAGALESPGGLARLLDEAAEALGARGIVAPAQARAAPLWIGAFSGGYRAAAACLERGGRQVSGVLLFDALYGRIPSFIQWLADDPERSLVALYGRSSAPGTEALRAGLAARQLPVRAQLPPALEPGAWLARVETEHLEIPALGPPARPLAALLSALRSPASQKIARGCCR